ncbi:RNA polymerase sigma-70 factor [Sphingobacterium multivorum]|uniref:RNA polymerase sigma factor n=1 Tax=Sphingobacterium TaxID=28453 RepID=UPI000DF8CEC5|nr:RNA polymerase sigma-70 factor [Sphingobacterium multivorum]QQT46900.1 RNA polymerase sigma-70 factor [Sphingobacterium multivorum]QQT60559.1 RNA polymerase sigma-70 factor [Sphingobacterium multivorum]SUJ88800.1 Sigma-24 [Sphingobacterium multivorum]
MSSPITTDVNLKNEIESKYILQRLQQGDRQVFDLIFKSYWDPLLIYLSKLVKDQTDAEDLLQNIFVNLWNKTQSSEIQDIHGWLYGAARKSALFYHRTQGNQKKLIASILEYIDVTGFSLSEQQQGKELQQIIDREIERLPAKMKEVFLLSRQEQLSYKEIAERLNISDQTVKKQISNALNILRNNLKKQGLYSLLLLLLIDLK